MVVNIPPFLSFLLLVAGEASGRKVHQPHAALAQGRAQRRQRRGRPRPTHLLKIRLLMEEKCITRRDIVLRKCCTGIELDGWEERCEPLEEGFSFGVCCAWWLDRCGARGGCYHRLRLLVLCSLRHPRMLGGGGDACGEGRGTEGVSLLLVIYCFLHVLQI
jgi:hypothetical protein